MRQAGDISIIVCILGRLVRVVVRALMSRFRGKFRLVLQVGVIKMGYVFVSISFVTID